MKLKATLIRLLPTPPRSYRGLCLLWLLIFAGGQAASAATLPEQLIGATQSFLERSVDEYLQRSEINARHEIEINRLDPRLRLPLCDRDLTVSLESPAQPIGRVTTRVRCDGSARWTVFVPAQVRLFRPVVVASRPLKRNAVVSEPDLLVAEHDVGLLHQGYLTDATQALGKKLTRSLLTDQVIAPRNLELAEVIRKGDQVVIIARTGTVGVRMPGEAMTDGGIGEQISVRNLRSSRVVKARVTGPGQVEVAM